MSESTRVIQKTIKPLLPTLVDAALTIERLRVASEVRQSHLARQGKQDPETDELHRRIKDLEDFVDGRVAHLIDRTYLLLSPGLSQASSTDCAAGCYRIACHHPLFVLGLFHRQQKSRQTSIERMGYHPG